MKEKRSFQQGLKFKSVGELMEFLPANEAVLLEYLRELVYENIPAVKEKLSFNVPAFYRNRSICLIWPGSVPWGKVNPGQVSFNFTQANLFSNTSFLEKGNRKQVFSKTFYRLEDINVSAMRSLLQEANQLDYFFKTK